MRALARLLARWAAMEERRFILFAPCLMMAGILLCFGLPGVPVWLSLIPCGAGGALWWEARRRNHDGALQIARTLTMVCAGFALMTVRFAATDAPMVPAELGGVSVTGVLAEVELREMDRRYTILVQSISGLASDALPDKVRVVWRGAPGQERVGDTVALRASIGPPPGPVLPGGYDFARQMRFEGIGGTGFAYAPPEIVKRGGTGLRDHIERLREAVADRAEQSIGGNEGAVAAALMTGKRERIPAAAVDALRDAGLAHLLAISGLHMGLVCGFLFFTARRLLVQWEWLALRMPIKKFAAAGALLGGAFYLALSGGAWSAQRAFIMAAIVFLAIIFDRRGISLRNAAIAALIILTLRPEAVLAPGFQMSFAAVVTLVASFEAIERRWPREGDRGPLAKGWRFMSGLTLTSLLAGFATGPFAAYHFGRIASYGLLGNMLAMPIITLAVMPALVLAMFLMPLGLDGPVLFLVGQGLGLVLAIAQWTADLPGAVDLVPQLAPAGLAAASAGLLLLALLSSPWRLAGAAMLALALPLSLGHRQADVYLSRDLRNVGIRQDEGPPLMVLSTRRDRFSLESWLQAMGEPQETDGLAVIAGCDKGPCAAKLPGGGSLHVVANRALLADACREGDVVILQASLSADDTRYCSALLVALDNQRRHPAASLRRERNGWVLTRAE